MTSLHIPQPVYEALRAHGEDTYPHECCGALLGTSSPEGWRVTSAVRAGNTRTDSAHNRYNIDPAELVKIQRDAMRQGLDIAGFYHSHPDHPAQWSLTDFAEAHCILAGALQSLGKLEEAVAECRTAIRIKPDAFAHYILGAVLQSQGRLTEAIAHQRGGEDDGPA